METMIWYAVEKTLPPLNEEVSDYDKTRLEKLETDFLSTLNTQQQDLFMKLKNEYEHIIEEVIYKRSGFVFSYGLKCGIEMEDCFEEIDRKL